MSRVTPQMRNFADRLMACETGGNKSAGTKDSGAFQVCEKLRPHLVSLMGKAGFRGLLARALALATVEAPQLQSLRLKADGAIEGLVEFRGQADHEEFMESGVVLLACLLGLLVAFIGEHLTLRLVREVWPKVPLHGLDFSIGGEK